MRAEVLTAGPNQPYDSRADIWSAGVILYVLLFKVCGVLGWVPACLWAQKLAAPSCRACNGHVRRAWVRTWSSHIGRYLCHLCVCGMAGHGVAMCKGHGGSGEGRPQRCRCT